MNVNLTETGLGTRHKTAALGPARSYRASVPTIRSVSLHHIKTQVQSFAALNMAEPQQQPMQPEMHDYQQVKMMLELSIACVEKKANVSLEDDFFVKANIRIKKKNRNRPRDRLLISEQDTSQENLTDETVKFHFGTSFEEKTSVSLVTTQGLTAGIGALLGGSMGGNIGLQTCLQYSQRKRSGKGTSSAATKDLSADVEVKPKTLVIVKELVYEVEWAAMCELELILRKEDKIKYRYEGSWSTKEKVHFIEVNKLLKRAKQQRASSYPVIEPQSPIAPRYRFPQSTARVRTIKRNNEATSEVHPEDNTSRTTSPSAESNHPVDFEDIRHQYATPLPDSDHGDSSTSPRKTDEDLTPLQKGSDTNSKIQMEDSSTSLPPAIELEHQEDLEYPRHQNATSVSVIDKKSFLATPSGVESDVSPLQNRKVSFSEVQMEENVSVYPPESNNLESLTHQNATLQRGLESESPNSEVDVMPLALYHHVMLTENMIIITFLSDCLFNREEHKLEIIKLSSDPNRVKKIIDHQTGVSHQNNQRDTLLSLRSPNYEDSLRNTNYGN